jgi:hypothetical protein
VVLGYARGYTFLLVIHLQEARPQTVIQSQNAVVAVQVRSGDDTLVTGQILYQGLFNTALIARGTLTGAAALRSDWFLIGDWFNLRKVAWDYVPNGQKYNDSAVILRWEPRTLAPSQTLSIGAYYGLGGRDHCLRPTFSECEHPQPSFRCAWAARAQSF